LAGEPARDAVCTNVNILVVKPSSLGDVTHALPAVNLLRTGFPDSFISWIVNDELADVVRCCPGVDETIPFSRRRWGSARNVGELLAFVRSVRSRKYDVAVDFQGLLRSGLISFASRAPRRIGYANAREGAILFYTERVTVPEEIKHAVDKNFHLVRQAFGLDGTPCFPSLRAPQSAEAEADRLLAAHDLDSVRPLVGVAPAARWNSKAWPTEFFARVLDTLATTRPDARFWLIGTADEKAIGQALLEACTHAAPENLMGKTSLPTLIALLQRSKVVVTNDTGPMHLAAAVGVRTVAVFGPTEPDLTGPYGQHHIVYRARECPQAPCFKKVCPLPQPVCTGAVDPETAATDVLRILTESSEGGNNRERDTV